MSEISLGKYFLLGALTLIFVGLLTPIMRKVALSVGAVDAPTLARKVQKEPVPYLGGVAIAIGVVGASYAALLAEDFTMHTFKLASFVLVPAIAISIMGLIDDLKGLEPWPRLIAQTFTGIIVAVSTTGTLAVIDPQQDAPTIAFLGGTAVALIGFYRVQTFVGHVFLYGYIFISGIMAVSDLTPDGAGAQIFIGTFLLILGSAWIFFTYKEQVDRLLGYLFGGATLFIATQVLFFRTEHLVSYLSMIAVACATAWLYLRVHAWPLVLTSVATTTVGVGAEEENLRCDKESRTAKEITQ